MCTTSKKDDVVVSTRTEYYSPSKEKVDNRPPTFVLPHNGPLHLEQPNPNTVICLPPKGLIRKSSFNPHACASQNYSIVEGIA